ncbi:GntR family transcriptional regulator [Corynebacterium lubricantis]|uniref:GntR family transcriptional regulator n=1 Tax=Corynebacterium lubricantis TaxID=541095 RepID=UPI00037A6CE4|nr:GntR family transcriptional regulator [Corynebacterium lubricantis]
MPRTELDSTSGVPLYRQIKDILRNEIESGDVDMDRPLTEARLLERFAVSRAPIRQALSELTTEGYVYRRQGKGTFPVLSGRVERPTDLAAGGLQKFLAEHGAETESIIRDFGWTTPPAHVARAIESANEESLLHFSRLITSDDLPLVDAEAYLRAPDSFNPTAQEVEEAGSVFTLLEQASGIPVVTTEHETWATGATEEQADRFQVTPGSPLLAIETVFYSTGKRALGWRMALHRADVFRYSFSEQRSS